MKKEYHVLRILVILFSVIFFMVLFFMDGVLVSNDTLSYVEFTYGREPLYPLFLALFRFLFGENRYFTAVVLVQCLLAAFSVYRLTDVIDQKFHLDRLSFWLIPFFQYAVVLLCRFAASRRATYCNEICSEGLAIPLFALFMAEVFQYVWYQKKGNLIALTALGSSLILVRKQMYIVIAILLVIGVSMLIMKRIRLKKFLWCLLAIAGTIFLSIEVDLLYNFCLRGEAMRHTTDASAMVVTTLYCSQPEDSVYFEDQKISRLFLDIMEEVEEKQYNYKYAQGNWLSRYTHYADHYDLIGYTIVNPNFYEYLGTHYTLSDNEREQAFDELNQIMLSTLLPVNFVKICKVTFINMMTGVCNTISKASSWLTWYNILFVILYLIFMIRSMVRKKNPDLAWFSFIILVGTAINVGAVGFMIFAQTRYMVYNMPLVYMALYLLMRDFAREKWQSRLQNVGE